MLWYSLHNNFITCKLNQQDFMFFLDLFNFRMIGRIIESRLKQANVLAREAVNTPMY